MIIYLISKISFTPRKIKKHLINIFKNKQHINDNPFKIIIDKNELDNTNKIRITDKNLQNDITNEINEFIIDTKNTNTKPNKLPTINQLFIQNYFFIIN